MLIGAVIAAALLDGRGREATAPDPVAATDRGSPAPSEGSRPHIQPSS